MNREDGGERHLEDEPLHPEDEPLHPEDEFFPSPASDGYQIDSERYPSAQEARARRRLRAHGVLRKAADLFGATPTALARLLVNRGADAVVKAHWAELKALRERDREG